MDTTDVLIVGAGPTGLVLACELARRGIAHRLIERRAGPQPGSRGFSLKPRSLDVLDDLGVVEAIEAAGLRSAPLRVHFGTAPLFAGAAPPPVADPRAPHPAMVSLPQWRTEAVLRDRLVELGGAIEWGARLDELDADADGVTATVTHDGTAGAVRARYVVGTDGGRSQVRRQLGVAFEGANHADAQALLTDVRVTGLADRRAVHLWLDAEGMLAIRPTPDGDVCQVVASLAPGTDPATMDLAAVREMVARRTGRTDIRLTDPTWLSVWRYNLRMVDRYRVGRVLLAGDAAHVHSPFGGYGMNTGIQDAYNLGWKLALRVTGAAGDGLLDTYQEERLPVARAVLADSDQRLSRTVPPAFLRPLLRLVVRRMLLRGQRRDREDCPTYPTSRLSVGPTGRRGPRAGDRAPDGRLADGVRLFDLYRGGHLTALRFGDVPSAAGTDLVREHRIGPEHAAVWRAHGARAGTLVVVRPDGYLGLIDHDPGPEALRDYLAEVLR